jgi:hypothetical protein
MQKITLYCPSGDGVEKNSHTITYTNIKDFKLNNNGTVTFKTQKHGVITTALLWRLSDGLPEEVGNGVEGEAAVPLARRRY